ncbi:MAG: NPCBM/NEW2 domain-containing protein [Planctomycetia bacterium]|nr:NPCBM/NEW2 domain-containing protein [Planctomycetia bacterium]
MIPLLPYYTAVLLLAISGPEVQVHTLSGQSYRGPLESLDADRLTMAVGEKSVTVPRSNLQQLNSLGASVQQPKAEAWVELIDGSRVAIDRYTSSGTTAKLSLSAGGEAKVPARRVRMVRFRGPQDERSPEWLRIVAAPPTSDVLIVRKKDKLDVVSGVIGDVDEQAVSFRLDNDTIRVPLAKVAGLIYFYPHAERLPAAESVVTVDGGSRWPARQLSLVDGALRLVSPAGLETTLPLGRVRQIDFNVDKFIYLSDIEPDAVQWSPYFAAGRLTESLTRLFRPRKDRALLAGESAGDDGALKLLFPAERGAPTMRSFSKGLALHGRTQMEYALPERFSRFQATVGIDARISGRAAVRLTVRGDDKELFVGTIAAGEAPKPLDLDVKNVRKLTLLVDFAEPADTTAAKRTDTKPEVSKHSDVGSAEPSDVGSYLDLCEARLVR